MKDTIDYVERIKQLEHAVKRHVGKSKAKEFIDEFLHTPENALEMLEEIFRLNSNIKSSQEFIDRYYAQIDQLELIKGKCVDYAMRDIVEQCNQESDISPERTNEICNTNLFHRLGEKAYLLLMDLETQYLDIEYDFDYIQKYGSEYSNSECPDYMKN